VSLDAVYITYWSLRDPLCLSQSLPVLRSLAGKGRRLGLVTFEQAPWAMPPDEAKQTRRALAKEGIRWEPLHYHKRPLLMSTLFDVVCGLMRCLRLSLLEGVRVFHARGTVAAAVAYGASLVTGARFLNDADGPLSEEYVDAGVWKRGSLPHRLTSWAETRFLRTADAVAVLTERRREEVRGLTRGKLVVLPCGVDTAHFLPDPGAGKSIRDDLGLKGVVLVYVGKAGGWYLTDAMLDFAKVAAQVLGQVSILVLTTEDRVRFEDSARRRGLFCVVRSATRDEMPRYLSAGDSGLSFVLPAPSKTACSPVKNGEYLACGLPIVTTTAIGDYTSLVVRRRVGVVVESLDQSGYEKATRALRDVLTDPLHSARCRETACAEVGLNEIVIPRYLELYRGLLG
jgi:glycosyltransferase involved in cell wall biosynthesis